LRPVGQFSYSYLIKQSNYENARHTPTREIDDPQTKSTDPLTTILANQEMQK